MQTVIFDAERYGINTIITFKDTLMCKYNS
jgi:hypothetical protein